MEIIIGIGGTGSRIAEGFAEYEKYKIYNISNSVEPSETSFKLPDHDEMEDYENENSDLQEFLSGIAGNVLVVLSGTSRAANSALYIMGEIHARCNISVLYVSPERELLGETKKIQENLVRNVLQQYARSAAIERIYMVSNEVLADITGDASVYDYYKNINTAITSTVHMVNVLDNTESVTDTYSPPHPAARISTFGVVDPDSGHEKLFYPIENIREARYYYAIPDKDLREDTQLLKIIVKQVKKKITGRLKASYGIYQSVYNDKYAYLLCHSSAIQEK